MPALSDDLACLLRELDIADTGFAHRAHQRSPVALAVRELSSAADALDLDHSSSSVFPLARIDHAKATIPWRTGELSSTFSLCSRFGRAAFLTSSPSRIEVSPILHGAVAGVLSRASTRASLALLGTGMQELSTQAFPLSRGWFG
jgi:hypothetical protein